MFSIYIFLSRTTNRRKNRKSCEWKYFTSGFVVIEEFPNFWTLLSEVNNLFYGVDFEIRAETLCHGGR